MPPLADRKGLANAPAIPSEKERARQADEIQMNTMIIIIDFGRSYIKVGIGGSSRPTYIHPVMAPVTITNRMGRSPYKLDHYVKYCEGLLREAFTTGLPIVMNKSICATRVCWITGSLSLPLDLTRALAITLFSDQYKFDAITFLPSPGAVLSTFPIPTGLVVDMSGKGIQISGIIDGNLIGKSIKSLVGGGDLVTYSLRWMLIKYYECCESALLSHHESIEGQLATSKLTNLKPGWRFCKAKDVRTFTWTEWNNLKATCLYVSDSTAQKEGKFKVKGDAFVPVKDGKLVVMIPRAMRYLASEVIFWDTFLTSAESPRPYVHEAKWCVPWSRLLNFMEEKEFGHMMSKLEPDTQLIGPGERMLRTIRDESVNRTYTDANQGLVRALIGSLEHSGICEGSILAQNIILCGGASEMPGMKERLANELTYAYSNGPYAEPFDEDPFPEPSKGIARDVKLMKFGKLSFVNSTVAWIGASINAEVILRQCTMHKAIKYYDFLARQRAPTSSSGSEGGITGSTESIKSAGEELNEDSLSQQILFRSLFNPFSPLWDFVSPDLSIPSSEVSRGVIRRLYDPGADLMNLLKSRIET